MALRPTPDPEVVPLVRAIKARIDALGLSVTVSSRDGIDVYTRGKTSFLQLELKRDHMNLDLWLTGEQLEEARSSGIARSHPFLGDEAVKVRFERAEDLSRVARWVEASFEYAPDRAKKDKSSSERVVEKTVPLIKPFTPPQGSLHGKNGAARSAPALPVTQESSESARASKPIEEAREAKPARASTRTARATKKASPKKAKAGARKVDKPKAKRPASGRASSRKKAAKKAVRRKK